MLGLGAYLYCDGALTLHDAGVVGRESQPIFCDIDVHLVCKVDGLQELVQRPRGAGNSPKYGRRWSRAL